MQLRIKLGLSSLETFCFDAPNDSFSLKQNNDHFIQIQNQINQIYQKFNFLQQESDSSIQLMRIESEINEYINIKNETSRLNQKYFHFSSQTQSSFDVIKQIF